LIKDAGDGWIVDHSFRRLTPNRYSPRFQKARCEPIELVVYHYTAGGFSGALSWLTSKDSAVSAHFIVKKDGEIWQLAPLSERCWHAGGKTSAWRGVGRVNNRSIGIEIENWGQLKIVQVKDRILGKDVPQIQTHRGTLFSGTTFTAPDGAVWDAYTPQQLTTLDDLTQRLVVAFPQLLAPDKAGAVGSVTGRLVGHQHVDPTRKIDPGPAFPWERIVAAAYATKPPKPPKARTS